MQVIFFVLFLFVLNVNRVLSVCVSKSCRLPSLFDETEGRKVSSSFLARRELRAVPSRRIQRINEEDGHHEKNQYKAGGGGNKNNSNIISNPSPYRANSFGSYYVNRNHNKNRRGGSPSA